MTKGNGKIASQDRNLSHRNEEFSTKSSSVT